MKLNIFIGIKDFIAKINDYPVELINLKEFIIKFNNKIEFNKNFLKDLMMI